MATLFLRLAAINGFLAVALGAFGAHGLKRIVSAELLQVWKTGTEYHLSHALALLFVALLLERMPEAATGRLRIAGILFVAGIILFAGSLYALTLSGIRALGMITPLGGVCFLVGWAILATSSLTSTTARDARK